MISPVLVHCFSITFTKVYERRDERDDFDFDINNFPFLDGDVPRLIDLNLFALPEHLHMLLA